MMMMSVIMRMILKMSNMRMAWPGMIDHDDNDGNDDGDSSV